MRKSQKFIMGFLAILVMLIAYFVILQVQPSANTPFHVGDVLTYVRDVPYYNLVLFWIAFGLLSLAFLAFVISFLIPPKERFLTLYSENKNTLEIQKKAIESIILTKAKQKQFLEDVSPTVIVKTKKQKITGEIHCKVLDDTDFTARNKIFLQELHRDIVQMLNLEAENIQLSLKIKPRKIKTSSKQRVI
ncbi:MULTISPECIES: alkaline shock response membrane anchor protein AmaP [Brochothrix]|uniref:Alkaline shock response membrane anchor protein AmaP n=1 Tax=Brochothrix thermosphacta TaxID=2756 RepID=A0A1D2KWJ1_BROTH|nr:MULTISPECIES: alkaline shock response membrane anchor protein AmaP [Brochothrix]ANZ94026.1 hypothetical protein BFC19_00575 [Brochothrix thermosphacta]ANZ97677.1 hypothetical protein BFC20_08210 [Brochothrix thermosphacta]ATF27126.1 hypothetical protein CNY62_12530 [Brochothrix thermosphacta]ATH86485.1 hypothetical protein CPF12_12220 [Brochothrix thermosphacta]EUJ36140.1 hypothetical protein BTHER_07471 [Brochothrix thermosphacta DSM 20171 = FSL F6-1036]